MAIIDPGFEYEPMYYWSKIFCVSPFTMVVSPTRRYFKRSILARIATIVMLTVYIVYIICILYFAFDDSSTLNIIQMEIALSFSSLNVLLAVVTIVMFVFNSDKIINCLNTVKELDDIIEKDIKIENSSVRRLSFLFFVMCNLWFCCWIFTLRPEEIVAMRIVAYSLYVNLTIRYQFIAWCLIFTERFKAINNYLSTFSKFSSIDNGYKIMFRKQLRQSFRAEDLKRFSVVRARLCNCVRDINNVYAVHILFYTGICFIWITTQCFAFVSILFKFVPVTMNTFTWIFGILWLAYVVADSITFLWICSEVSFHANDMKRHLIRFKLNATDKKMHREMVNFLVQLVDDNLELTALGFFNLDIPFIQTIMGAVTTYSIIVLQSQYA